MKTDKPTQTEPPVPSVYRSQNPEVRAAFDAARSPRKVLLVALDYAKRKHVAMICDGGGDILKTAFPVDNSADGVDYLIGQVEATSRRRRISKKCIVFGGEDEPAYVRNFASAVRGEGYLVTRVNALEAKKNRENYSASTDALDLLGVAKTMLSRRAPPLRGADVYGQIRGLMRSRRGLVRQKTAASNRIHAIADVLFPGFLDRGKSGLTPFCGPSLKLMSERFSAAQVARRKQPALAALLADGHVHHPDETAAKIIALAKSTLQPEAAGVPAAQATLAATADLYACLERNATALKDEAALLLATTPYAFLTSVPGIGMVLAAGIAGELGDPARLGGVGSLSAYSGIVPRVAQSGGPDSPASHGTPGRRCNHILKDLVVQSSQKIALYGPPELRGRMAKWQANGQHAAFAGARSYLRLLRALVPNGIPYLDPAGRGPGASPEARAAACEGAWKVLVRKWNLVPGGARAAFAETAPVGFWRRVAAEAHGARLPLVL